MLDGWTWQMAWRDSKGSRRRLLLFLSAMVVGVAALVAILSFGYSLERSIMEDAGALLGGDIRLSSYNPFTEEEEALIDSLGGEQARRVSFSAAAVLSATGRTRTVRVRAMDAKFPLYGALAVNPPDAVARMHAGGGVLLSQSLGRNRRAEVPDSVTIRGRRMPVAGILLGTPVENAMYMLLEPPVYMALADLDSLQGRAATYQVFLKLKRAVDFDALRAEIRANYSLGYRTVNDETEDWQDFLRVLEGFLGLLGFFALMLGGLGVGSVLQVYLKERHDTVAVLRCVGATSRRAIGIYLAQAGMMGALVGVGAGLVGTLGQVVLPLGIADLLPVSIDYKVSPKGLVSGLILGIVGTLVFALLPLSGLRAVSPLEALRSAYGRRRFRKGRIVAYVLVGVGIYICAAIQGSSLWLALAYTVAVGACLGLLLLVAVGLIKLARVLTPRIRHYAVRQGMANLHRPANQTLLLVLALGLGTVMIMTQVLIGDAVLNAMSDYEFGGEVVPNIVMPAVRAEEMAQVRALAREHDLEIIGEMGRFHLHVDSIYGHSTADSASADAIADPAVAPEGLANQVTDSTRVSGDALVVAHMSVPAMFANQLTDSAEVLEGTYVAEWNDTTGVVPVAVSQSLLYRDFPVALGDTVLFRVDSTRTVLARIGGILSSDLPMGPGSMPTRGVILPMGPGSMPTHGVILPRGTLEILPHRRMVMLNAKDAESLSVFYGNVVDRYPNLNIFNVPMILGVIQEVLRRISYMIRFMSLFCIIAGIMVLAGAVMVSRRARIEQTVLLKTLGASKRQIYTIMCTEYLCLGLLATLVGLGLAVGAAWALTGFQLDVAFAVPKGPIVLAMATILGLTLGIGLLNSRGIYGRPPLEVLRAEV